MECREQCAQKTLCNHIDTQLFMSLRIIKAGADTKPSRGRRAATNVHASSVKPTHYILLVIRIHTTIEARSGRGLDRPHDWRTRRARYGGNALSQCIKETAAAEPSEFENVQIAAQHGDWRGRFL
jgi:hypothetical protein